MRTYVITGSASGIGLATAESLRAGGATVIGVDRRDAEVEADLSTPSGRDKAVADAVAAASGSIDAVIACAGVAAPRAVTASVNYFGMTQFLEGIRPVLARSPHPRAVLVSSVSVVHPYHPDLVEALLRDDEAEALAVAGAYEADDPTKSLIYQSSKRAIGLWLRREAATTAWAGAGIPLNGVAPGLVLTPMTAPLLASEEGRAKMNASVPTPLNHHQTVQTIADLLIWLASEQNTHLCGQMLFCDGGAELVLRGVDAYSFADATVATVFANAGAGQ
ncbi:SDR family oxidoreductase [Microbacterium sp. 22303]|uniref:SDR family oxidoreductase n=1 Tax=Microbacterium sp. 22303 TaxID=3453905 RepID=UPI003F876A74